ncbi:sulfurtransferase complex subunit TusB [Thiofilum flexile]|uniref:sulfurtransferase complex subunit TusB n=1 Tax=Thiofilum flexile TaxID=125627 RepID=UPI00036DE228|nr:sulfurtransferase complex subunit TusB [Thiofilum flexile]
MSMLHIVNKSPFERNALASCLSHASKGDAVLLIEDAVLGAVAGSQVAHLLLSALATQAIYVLSEDLAARGMEPNRLVKGLQVVDYSGFVDLTVQHDKNQSWL